MKFRKRPVTIEAIQWTGDNFEEIKVFAGNMPVNQVENDLLVYTLEGVMRASLNDWIIRGVKNEIYPCKPEIFAATYEAAE